MQIEAELHPGMIQSPVVEPGAVGKFHAVHHSQKKSFKLIDAVQGNSLDLQQLVLIALDLC